MGKRSTSRRIAMQAIYQAEMVGIPIQDALDNILSEEDFIPETKDFAVSLAAGSWKEKEKWDEIISELAIDWPLDRIGKVDRAILRLALYELEVKETPTSVAIDEAVELAKKYSTEEAAKFVNGILGTYLKKKEKVC